MKSKITKFTMMVVLMLTFGTIQSFAQEISIGGQLGWANPKGGSFVDANGEKMAGGGLAFDVDALYHPEIMNHRLGVGLTMNSSILVGVSTGAFEAGLYGLSLYGVKGQYRFFDSGVSPYFSFSTGLSKLSTPEISDMEGNVILEESSSASFGMRPEVGLDLGGFIISAGYFVPMKYKITDATAGAFQVSLGYRYKSF